MAVLKFPKFMLKENGGYYTAKDSCAIDPCMINEIKYLWSHNIRTMGCCCGHGVDEGMINVLTGCDVKRMLDLGYSRKKDMSESFTPFTFKAKTQHIIIP